MAATPFKAQYGWSVRFLLPITPPGARFFHRHGISANAVSVLSLVAFVLGLPFYVLGHDQFSARAFASFCFIAGTYLDVVDGYVARLSGAAGNGGAYVDAGIDVVRYNLFLASMYYVVPMPTGAVAALVVYGLLLNLSFVRLLRNIGKGPKIQQTNQVLEKVLPQRYKEFCWRWQLLYSPINLEDQLLFFLFVVAILFKLELAMIYCCTAVRLIELGMSAYARRMQK